MLIKFFCMVGPSRPRPRHNKKIMRFTTVAVNPASTLFIGVRQVPAAFDIAQTLSLDA